LFDAIVEPFARVHRVDVIEIQVSGEIVGQRKGVVDGERLEERYKIPVEAISIKCPTEFAVGVGDVEERAGGSDGIAGENRSIAVDLFDVEQCRSYRLGANLNGEEIFGIEKVVVRCVAVGVE
jgi:hypothetical protein